MRVGQYLKETHDFDKQETIDNFCDIYGYTEIIITKIVEDRYQALLTCHINDLASFTGEDPEFLHSLEERHLLSELDKACLDESPMGKPYVTENPVMGKLVISDKMKTLSPKRIVPGEEVEIRFSARQVMNRIPGPWDEPE